MVYQVKDLVKKFGDNVVLDHINLEIKENEKIVIIGPSGGGKSTFLRCLNLLEKPTSGQIIYHGQELTEKTYKAIQGKIGMVFQNFQLFDNMTVSDLKQIHLDDKDKSYPADLSGGQRQRVAIIRTLIMEPSVILFDEPTSALDPEMIGEVLSLMMEVSKQNITMIVVTHELKFAYDYATRVLFMDQGKIVEDGDKESVFKHPKTERLKQFLDNMK